MSIVQGFGFSMESGDAADLLPEPAADKLRSLRQALDDARNVARPIYEKIQELQLERRDHTSRVRKLLDPRGIGGFDLDASDVQSRDVQKKIDKIDAELARLREIDEVRSHKRGEIAVLVSNVEDYLRSGRPSGTIFEPYIGDPPQLRKNENVTDAIEARRRRLREIAADVHQIESRPLPSSVAKARMREQVEQWALAGAPSVEAAIWFGTDVTFPKIRLRSEIRLEKEFGLAFGEVHDPLALLAWRDKAGLIARLDAEIMAAADDEHALSADEKAKQVAVLTGDALAVSREEEALICLAATSGTEVMRRADADPRAVLQIELITAASRSASMPPIVGFVKGLISQ